MSGVLYDAPGPRTRRLSIIGSIVAVAAVAVGAYFFVYLPLAANGQFSMQKWGPLIDPGNEYFSLLWNRLRQGFTATLTAAACAIAASAIIGTGLAVLRVQLRAWTALRFGRWGAPIGLLLRTLMWLLNLITRVAVEIFRGVPVVVTILFVWLALREYDVRFADALWYLVIGLTIYNSIVIGEILRSGMDGLPTGQREAADSLGLSPFQTVRLVLLPQAYRIMLPALISQLVVVLKDTSLGFIISYEEVMRVSSQAVQILNNPLQLYLVVGAVFVVVNYSLSKLAAYVQRSLGLGRLGPGLLWQGPVRQGRAAAALDADKQLQG
jgi:glutamate transport system permease protein